MYASTCIEINIPIPSIIDCTCYLVQVWDITTGHCLHTLQGPNKHQSAVTSLQFTDNFVVTSSDDGTVKLWDLKTGEFVRNLVHLDSGGNGKYTPVDRIIIMKDREPEWAIMRELLN